MRSQRSGEDRLDVTILLCTWNNAAQLRVTGNGLLVEEPRLEIESSLRWNQSARSIELRPTVVRSDNRSLRLIVAGQVDQLGTDPRWELEGTVDYDLERVVPLLQPYVGGGVHLVGRGKAPFQVRVPHVDPTFHAPPSQLSSSRPSWSRRPWGPMRTRC